ncbi:MAG: glycosyltransferase [Planctomycetota bacterium]
MSAKSNHIPRLLLCTYDPSLSGGNHGGRRAHLYIEPLTAKGWKVDVLTTSLPDSDPECTRALLERCPNVRLIRSWPGPTATLRRLASGPLMRPGGPLGEAPPRKRRFAVRVLRTFYHTLQTLAVPDEKVEWLPFLLPKTVTILWKTQYACLLSWGFPRVSVLAGYLINLLTRCPWIIDYAGEPWGFSNHLPKWRLPLDRAVEGKMLRAADRIIVASQEMKRGFEVTYGSEVARKVAVVSFGFDPDPCAPGQALCPTGFRMVHTGVLYPGRRTPRAWFDALVRLAELDALAFVHSGKVPYDVRICGPFIHMRRALGGKFQDKGYLTRQEVVELQKSATVLIAFLYEEYALPIKLFEYIGLHKPLLVVRQRRDDPMGRLIEDRRWGVVVDNEAVEIECAVRRLHSMWVDGTLSTRFTLSDDRDEFLWPRLGLTASKIVDEVSHRSG